MHRGPTIVYIHLSNDVNTTTTGVPEGEGSPISVCRFWGRQRRQVEIIVWVSSRDRHTPQERQLNGWRLGIVPGLAVISPSTGRDDRLARIRRLVGPGPDHAVRVMQVDLIDDYVVLDDTQLGFDQAAHVQIADDLRLS